MQVQVGTILCVVLGTDAHILRRSKSSYGMLINGHRLSYCCQDGCCDGGLRSDVEQAVERAKEHDVTRVILRTGQRFYYIANIAGLPVSDVSRHIGVIDDQHEVTQMSRY